LHSPLTTHHLRLPIGILGGTFDPIHYGHLRPADEVRKALALSEIRVIPAAQPPHRRQPVASAAQRLRMAELAVAQMPGFVIDDREYRRGGPSYTVLTLESLRAEFGTQPLCLLMGMDAFIEIESWHQWSRLPALAHFVVMHRPGSPLPAAESDLPEWARARIARSPRELAAQPAGGILFQPVTPQDISATRIRAAIAAREDVRAWLPPAVWQYIDTHNLYRDSPD
jgi:nicotinate-nucleotide adenylyltransferase